MQIEELAARIARLEALALVRVKCDACDGSGAVYAPRCLACGASFTSEQVSDHARDGDDATNPCGCPAEEEHWSSVGPPRKVYTLQEEFACGECEGEGEAMRPLSEIPLEVPA